MPDSILCRIRCADGSEFAIRGCIKGKLVEMNDRLAVKPQVLNAHPTIPAYIAILLVDKQQQKCLKELYNLSDSPIISGSAELP